MHWCECWLLLCELLVEVTRICIAIDNWPVRRWYPRVEDVIPVNIPEERLFLDFFRIALARAQAAVRITSKQLCKYQ
jgi:hypothetical protein